MITISYSKSPEFVRLVLDLAKKHKAVFVTDVTRATLYKRLVRAGYYASVSTDHNRGAVVRDIVESAGQ